MVLLQFRSLLTWIKYFAWYFDFERVVAELCRSNFKIYLLPQFLRYRNETSYTDFQQDFPHRSCFFCWYSSKCRKYEFLKMKIRKFFDFSFLKIHNFDIYMNINKKSTICVENLVENQCAKFHYDISKIVGGDRFWNSNGIIPRQRIQNQNIKQSIRFNLISFWILKEPIIVIICWKFQ